MAVKSAVADSQLVVIGSSAGGIEALSRVVASLPADFPVHPSCPQDQYLKFVICGVRR